MTYREAKKLREIAYKAFIEQKYGKQELDKLELAIKKDITDKILEIRDEKEFVDTLTELREGRENDEY